MPTSLDQIIFWTWFSFLLVLIGPLSIYVTYTSEREMFLVARARAKTRTDIFLGLLVPPYSWETAKHVKNQQIERLQKTLSLYVSIWFWFGVCWFTESVAALNLADWCQIAALVGVTAWIGFVLAHEYLRGRLAKVFWPFQRGG